MMNVFETDTFSSDDIFHIFFWDYSHGVNKAAMEKHADSSKIVFKEIGCF